MVGMLKSQRLKWVHTGAAGLDHPIWAPAGGQGRALTTGHGQALCIAEYVLAEVLGHFQRSASAAPSRPRTAGPGCRSARSPARSWLIVGFGAIGQGVAERAKAFGASIVGVRRSGAADPLAERMGALAEVSGLLPAADVVVLATPLNAETAGMADAGLLRRDEAGSRAGQRRPRRPGRRAGAAGGAGGGRAGARASSTCSTTEPLKEDSPFWDHPKVSLTPHASAFGSGQAARNDAIFLENLRRRLAGEPMLYEADPRDLR